MFVKNEFLKNVTANVSSDISDNNKLYFDDNGIAELSDERGKLLCKVPGFEEVKKETGNDKGANETTTTTEEPPDRTVATEEPDKKKSGNNSRRGRQGNLGLDDKKEEVK